MDPFAGDDDSDFDYVLIEGLDAFDAEAQTEANSDNEYLEELFHTTAEQKVVQENEPRELTYFL